MEGLQNALKSLRGPKKTSRYWAWIDANQAALDIAWIISGGRVLQVWHFMIRQEPAWNNVVFQNMILLKDFWYSTKVASRHNVWHVSIVARALTQLDTYKPQVVTCYGILAESAPKMQTKTGVVPSGQLKRPFPIHILSFATK